MNLAGEAHNPGRSVPFAIFGSIALSTVVYLLLQVAFLGSVAPDHLHEGWAALEYSSPFAQLALALNLNLAGRAALRRCLRQPQRHRHHLHRHDRAHGLCHAAQWDGARGIRPPASPLWDSTAGDVVQLAVAFIFLFFFRGWGKLAAVISVATIITFLVVPISVIVLRRTAPLLHRPLRVPALPVLAPMAFVLATLMLYWARWPHTGQIMLLLLAPMPVFLYYQARAGWPDFGRQLRAASWLIAYLLAITALSWAGSKEFEGHDYIGYGWDQLCVAVAALVFYAWGVRSGWRTPAIEAVENNAKAAQHRA